MGAIEWVLFDLGGVVLHVDQSNVFERLSAVSSLPAPMVERLMLGAEQSWRDFGEREIAPSELAATVNRVLNTSLSVDVVVCAFNAELGAQIDATVELLPNLRRRTQVGCLSNTNSIHWDELLRSYPCMNLFDRRFASQLLGLQKPDKAIYERVGGLLGVKPQTILFFDDREENVVSAHRVGWNARHYTGHQSLLAGLQEFSLL